MADTTYQQDSDRARELMREWQVRCSCGWNTGDHAPECDIESAWERAMAWAADERAEAEAAEQAEVEWDDCPLDGDHDNTMQSIGWGTDEDYGFYGDDGGW